LHVFIPKGMYKGQKFTNAVIKNTKDNPMNNNDNKPVTPPNSTIIIKTIASSIRITLSDLPMFLNIVRTIN